MSQRKEKKKSDSNVEAYRALNWIERFFCFSGGAKLEVLKLFPTEKYKFLAIGIGVINTALLSMATMWFAIQSTVSPSGPFAHFFVGLFAFFWGLIIFGIDWGLVTTLKKRKEYTNRKDLFTTLTGVALRLFIAILISFTVSRPLEALIFKPFIPISKDDLKTKYITDDKLLGKYEANLEDAALKQEALSFKAEEFRESLRTLDQDQELVSLKQRIEAEQVQIDRLNQSMSQYQRNIGVSSRKIESLQTKISGYKDSLDILVNKIESSNNKDSVDLYNQRKELIMEALSASNSEMGREERKLRRYQVLLSGISRDRNSFVINRDSLQKSYTTEKNEKASYYNQTLAETEQSRSFRLKEQREYDSLKRATRMAKVNTSDVWNKDNLINDLVAIKNMVANWTQEDGYKQEIGNLVKMVGWLIMLTIMFVDTAPIIIKLLVNYGPYDEFTDKFEEYQYVKQTDDLKAKIDFNGQFAKEKDAVLRLAIDKWKEKMTAEMDEKYKDFIP